MKVKHYQVESIGKSIYFCPSCHRQLVIPFKGDVNIQGSLKIVCSNCKKGTINITKLVVDKT